MRTVTLQGICLGCATASMPATCITAYVAKLEFYDEQGERITPETGSVRIEASPNEEDWYLLQAGLIDYDDGQLLGTPKIVGQRTKFIRFTFTGIPEGTRYFTEIDSMGIPDASIDPRVYRGFQAVTMQPFTEANVKNGLQYFVNINVPSIATSGVRRYLFETGNKDVLIKAIELNGNSDLFSYQVFKDVDPTLFSLGAPLAIYNYSDKDPVTETTEIREVTALNAGSEGDPWGDRVRYIGSLEVGNRPSKGTRPPGIERQCDKNKFYMVELRNLSTTNPLVTDLYMTWYEGPVSSLT
jgi:hypothetical protein